MGNGLLVAAALAAAAAVVVLRFLPARDVAPAEDAGALEVVGLQPTAGS